jgi:hypothetical protein
MRSPTKWQISRKGARQPSYASIPCQPPYALDAEFEFGGLATGSVACWQGAATTTYSPSVALVKYLY